MSNLLLRVVTTAQVDIDAIVQIFKLTLNKLMHIIDVRCFSGSEIALIEIDALYLVFLLMIASLQLTINCSSRRKF